MQTVAETPNYLRKAYKLFTEAERVRIIDMLAADPVAGDLMPETGGVRKVRFARGGRGKSGGARIIYYYYSRDVPLYLIDVFGKNEKANLSKAERHELAKLVALLKQALRGRT